jgi:5'-nucleotidase
VQPGGRVPRTSVFRPNGRRSCLKGTIVALILLTNDDGIKAEGLQSLRQSLLDLADIIVVAPDRERSAVSHGLTLRTPLELVKIDDNQYTLGGTPADCVIHALAEVVSVLPDLAISGINHGANLGDDIMYSGTVAGAREASRRGIVSLAISQAYDETPISFKKGIRFVRALVRRLLDHKANGGICLNINIPVGRIRGVKVTRQGCSSPFPHFNWFDGVTGGVPEQVVAEHERKSVIPLDYRAVRERCISITPLQRDQTDYLTVDSLLRQAPRLFPARRLPDFRLIG